jgi:hypothetical protein
MYEITYNIQGQFLFNCALGIVFALFINGQYVQSSATRATTGVGTFGQVFNISKTFCLFFSKGAKVQECNSTLLPTLQENAIQVRAVIDPNSASDINCISTITFPIQTGSTTVGTPPVTVPAFTLAPAGSLYPDNAFEITFKRVGDTCEQNNCK